MLKLMDVIIKCIFLLNLAVNIWCSRKEHVNICNLFYSCWVFPHFFSSPWYTQQLILTYPILSFCFHKNHLRIFCKTFQLCWESLGEESICGKLQKSLDKIHKWLDVGCGILSIYTGIKEATAFIHIIVLSIN